MSRPKLGENVSVSLPGTERRARDRHQLRTVLLAAFVLSGVALAAVAVALAAGTLDRYWFLHFPLGFYLVAQGLLILMVAAGFWFVRVQERLDQRRLDTEEIV
jgi:putative solute:sodium symporter small subunit